MNKHPIEREFVIKAKGLADAAADAEESIIKRITYIVSTMVNTWEQELDTWYFDDAAEGEVGNLWSNYNETQITPLIFVKHSRAATSMIFFDKLGGEWDLKDSFPSRWLFEDFEQELLDGKKKWENLEQERQEKIAALSKEKKSLVEKAKKKLTKEELNALRSVL